MYEGLARKILGSAIAEDNGLNSLGWYLAWGPTWGPRWGRLSATLDGEFTADELEAIAWWMRNKRVPNEPNL